MNLTARNAVIVARREYTWRVRSRTFVISTLLLMALGIAGAAAPILITLFVKNTAAQVGLYAPTASGQGSVSVDLAALLTANANPDPKSPSIVVVPVEDLDAARQQVVSGQLAGVLAVAPTGQPGEYSWTYYDNGSPFGQTKLRVQQTVNATAFQVRMLAAGLTPAQIVQASTPPEVSLEPADPSKTAGEGPSATGFGLGFGMTVIIFIAILVYGQWIAMSVAEEKSSRVMEVVLNAASPFQLLAGKVVGVGAVGFTQYAAVAVPALVVLLLQPTLESMILGTAGNASGPATELAAVLTPQLVIAFGAFFVLGFALYAVLYAGIASLVSRQEDLNPLIGPLTMVATLGYLLAAWTMAGLIVLPPAIVDLLSYVPFLSPYLMLARYAAGQAGDLEALIALVILAASTLVALWFAARLYSAGVLLYGQRPSVRNLIAILRSAG